jgi:TolA-binding protein
MKNRFEQLIEYVINDEEQKARELFHQIVVEKSREIYESLMNDDDDMGRMDRYDEDLGGDQADDLIDDVEVDEEGLSEEDDETLELDVDSQSEPDGMSMDSPGMDDEGSVEDRVEDLEDRLVDVEDEIDRLLDEYLNNNNDQEMEVSDDDMEATGDEMSMVDDEMETEGMRMPMEEAVSLKAAPKPTTSEESGINTKSTVAANSGSRGAMAHPVKMTGDTAQGRPAPTTKDLVGRVQNTPAQNSVKQEAAPKPHLAQATGVNTKTPFPKS